VLITAGVLVVVAGLIVGIIEATATQSQSQAGASNAPPPTVASTPGSAPPNTPASSPASSPSSPASSPPTAGLPVVSSISPTSGDQGGGTSVTISGTGFSGATGVRFGPNSASSVSVDSDTQITAVSPAGEVGTVDITVTTPAGTSVTGADDQFTYRVSPPAVSSISPTFGYQGGGTSVTISGTGFSGATGVRFGPNSASSVSVDSDTQITAVSPAGQVGTVDITVTTPAGTSVTSVNDQFTYRIG
jgi:hypothetical protein